MGVDSESMNDMARCYTYGNTVDANDDMTALKLKVIRLEQQNAELAQRVSVLDYANRVGRDARNLTDALACENQDAIANLDAQCATLRNRLQRVMDQQEEINRQLLDAIASLEERTANTDIELEKVRRRAW